MRGHSFQKQIMMLDVWLWFVSYLLNLKVLMLITLWSTLRFNKNLEDQTKCYIFLSFCLFFPSLTERSYIDLLLLLLYNSLTMYFSLNVLVTISWCMNIYRVLDNYKSWYFIKNFLSLNERFINRPYGTGVDEAKNISYFILSPDHFDW